MIEFGSVCSGIEAASVAWHPLGWKAAWLAEIEPFPCAVLAHHYPDVSNLGDMTTITGRVTAREVAAPDVFTGGTPCQAFSVAGKRQSLDDARGNLSLTFVEIADAIDDVRTTDGREPCIVVWENVPGVLSTSDNAFGCFLGALAGSGCELQPAGGRWTNAGLVLGPIRTVAWRIIDAQYFGLAQRRKRVFVVASARNGFDPAAVLFEFDGVRRDSAPSREAREVSPTIPSRSLGGGGLGTDFDCDGGLIQSIKREPVIAGCLNSVGGNAVPGNSIQDADQGYLQVVAPPISMCLNAGAMGRCDAESETLIPTFGGGFDDAYSIRTANTSSNGWGIQHEVTHTLDQAQGLAIAHTLKGEGFDASEDGTGRGTPLVPVGIFQDSEFGVAQYDSAGTLRAGRIPDHQMVIQPVPVCAAETAPCLRAGNPYNNSDPGMEAQMLVAFDTTQITSARAEVQAVAFQPGNLARGAGSAPSADVFPTLKSDHGRGASDQQPHVLVFAQNQRDEVRTMDVAGALAAEPGAKQQTYAMQGMAVRRLTPTECERLQGFSDGYTAIPYRNKSADLCPDGPRYKALGNSWAVPCARWIGQRIQEQIA